MFLDFCCQQKTVLADSDIPIPKTSQGRIRRQDGTGDAHCLSTETLQSVDVHLDVPAIARAPRQISRRSCFWRVLAGTNATSTESQRATAQDAATIRAPSLLRHSETTIHLDASHVRPQVVPCPEESPETVWHQSSTRCCRTGRSPSPRFGARPTARPCERATM
jgi:hypothetical protein